MPSNKLLRIVDYSLLPAALAILAKLFGTFFVLNSLGVDWGVAEFPNNLFSVAPIVYGKDLQTVATYSNLLLFTVLALGLGLQLLSLVWQRKPLHSTVIFRLLSETGMWKLLRFGANEFVRVYVWFIFLWLVQFFILLDVLWQRSAAWLLVLSALVTFSLTSVLLQETLGAMRAQLRNPQAWKF